MLLTIMYTDSHDSAFSDAMGEDQCAEIEEVVRSAEETLAEEGLISHELGEKMDLDEEKPVEGEQMTTEESADLEVAARTDAIKKTVETGGSSVNVGESTEPKETTGEGLPVEDEKTAGVDRRATGAKVSDKGAESGEETLEGGKTSTPPVRVLRKRPTVSPFMSESPANKRKRGSVDSFESDGDDDEDCDPDDNLKHSRFDLLLSATSEDEYVPGSDRADPAPPAPRKGEKRKRVQKSDNRKSICEICNQVFGSQRKLFEHTCIVHEGRKPYACEICGNTFTGMSGLRLHISSIHEGKKPYKCSFCNRNFSKSGHLRLHKCIVDQGSKKYTCDICGKKFYGLYLAKRHKAVVHEGQRPFSCDQCEATFKNTRSLRHHKIGFHGGTSAFYCDTCGRYFGTSGDLERHRARVHQGKSAFYCDCCGRYFGTSGDLERHRARVHQESKTAICQICGYRFERERHLHVHMSNVHKNELPYVCEVCKKGFPLINDLRVHKRRVHKLGVRKESQGSNDQKNLAARNPRRLLLPRPESTENQEKSETKNRNTPPVRLSVPAIFAFAAIPMVTIRMEDETDGQIGHAVDVPTNSPSRIPDNNEISQSGVRSTELSALPIGAALQAVLSNVFFAPNPETNSTFSSQSTKPAKCEDVAIRPDVDEPSVCRAKCEDIAIRPGAEDPCVYRVPTPASLASQSTTRSSPKRIKQEPSG